jgi:leucyl-tRNA synthetase
LLKDALVKLAVQVNGKLRATLEVAPDLAEAEVKALALADANVQKFVEGKEITKVVFVPGRLISFVVTG